MKSVYHLWQAINNINTYISNFVKVGSFKLIMLTVFCDSNIDLENAGLNCSNNMYCKYIYISGNS